MQQPCFESRVVRTPSIGSRAAILGKQAPLLQRATNGRGTNTIGRICVAAHRNRQNIAMGLSLSRSLQSGTTQATRGYPSPSRVKVSHSVDFDHDISAY